MGGSYGDDVARLGEGVKRRQNFGDVIYVYRGSLSIIFMNNGVFHSRRKKTRKFRGAQMQHPKSSLKVLLYMDY